MNSAFSETRRILLKEKVKILRDRSIKLLKNMKALGYESPNRYALLPHTKLNATVAFFIAKTQLLRSPSVKTEKKKLQDR